MPQNAVIAASGGDYTTLSAWVAGEEFSNYGEPTTFYVDGHITAGAIVVLSGAGGRFPHGVRGRALSGQEFVGNNATSCASITHTTSLIEASNCDVDLQGFALLVSGGYNNEVFRTSNTVTATQRRNITLKNLYIESAPFYHGSTHAIELNTASYASGAGSKYNLDIENVVILSRASNRGVYITGREGDQTFTGSVKNVTILPTNSGTSATNAFWIGAGSDSSLTVDKILSIAQEVRTNVTDYVNDGMGGTFTNISTNDSTGTVTGVTAAASLLDYASGDYRASGDNGAFVQSAPQAAYEITPEAGSFSIAGFSVSLTKHSVLNPLYGEYSLSGESVSALADRIIAPSTGSYSITATAVDFEYTELSASYEIAPEPASFAIYGGNVDIIAGRLLMPQQAEFAIAGGDPSILKGVVISPEVSSFQCYGESVGIIKDATIQPEPGYLDLAGYSVSLEYSGFVRKPVFGISLSYAENTELLSFKPNSEQLSFKPDDMLLYYKPIED